MLMSAGSEHVLAGLGEAGEQVEGHLRTSRFDPGTRATISTSTLPGG